MSSSIDFIETTIEKYIATDERMHEFAFANGREGFGSYQIDIVFFSRTRAGWMALVKTSLDPTLYMFEYDETNDTCEIFAHPQADRISPP